MQVFFREFFGRTRILSAVLTTPCEISLTGLHLTLEKINQTIGWFDGFLLVCQKFWFLKPDLLTNHHKTVTFPTYGFG